MNSPLHSKALINCPNNMKKSIITILLLAASLSWIQASPNTSIKDALHRATHQEMLTQSIAKSYLCIVLGISKEKHQQLLKTNVQQFENGLEELQDRIYNRAITEQLRQIERLWKHYKFICEGVYNEGNALILLELNTELLQACKEGVTLLQEHASNNSKIYEKELSELQALVTATQQKTLMQRMVLYTLAQKYNLGSPQFNEEKYSVAATSFTQNHKILSSPRETVASWATFEQKLTTIVNSSTTKEQAAAHLSPLISLVDEHTPFEKE